MLIFHISDLQLGYGIFDGTYSPQREQDFYSVWNAAVLEAVEREADLVAIAGDVFEYDGSRRNPITPASYVAFRDGLQTLSDHGIETVVVSGNHDTPRISTREHPLAVFDGLFRNVHVYYDEGDYLTITCEDTHFEIRPIPWVHEEPLTDDHFLEADLCILHAPSAVVDPNYGDHVRAFEAKYAERYKYVALGDWHGVRKVANNAWYPGALERTSFGQAQELTGGFFVTLDESGVVNREHWSSPARKMEEEVISGDPNAKLAKLVKFGAEGDPMLRVIFDNIDPTEVDPELLGELHDIYKFCKESWKNPTPSKASQDLKYIAIEDQWRQYCEDSDISEEVMKTGRKVLEEVRAV